MKEEANYREKKWCLPPPYMEEDLAKSSDPRLSDYVKRDRERDRLGHWLIDPKILSIDSLAARTNRLANSHTSFTPHPLTTD